MTDDVPLNIELTVRMGRGYLAATEQAEREPEVGVIPLDAAFSPVTRVRYKIEDTRVGQRTNYDKLNLEVWTNGTVTPEMAVVESAKILRKHLNPFISYREPGPGAAARRGPAGHARGDRLRSGRSRARGETGTVAGRAQPFGAGDQLPRVGRDQHGPRPGHAERRPAACRSATSARRRCRKFANGSATIGLRLGMKLPHQSPIG